MTNNKMLRTIDEYIKELESNGTMKIWLIATYRSEPVEKMQIVLRGQDQDKGEWIDINGYSKEDAKKMLERFT